MHITDSPGKPGTDNVFSFGSAGRISTSVAIFNFSSAARLWHPILRGHRNSIPEESTLPFHLNSSEVSF